MFETKKFDVKFSDSGSRLDKWLCGKLSGFSRKQIKTLLDGGKVFVNKKRVLIAGWELEEGDLIEAKIPQNFTKTPFSNDKSTESSNSEKTERNAAHLQKTRKKDVARALERPPKKKETEQENPDWRLKIYHEDKDVIVVEKPPYMLSISDGSKKGGRQTLYDKLKGYLRRKHKESGGSFLYALHRLDADTSGIMVFALSNEGKRIESQFKMHSIKREYIAIVEGRIESSNGVIKKPLEKGRFEGGRKSRPAKAGEGKTAITEYRVEERYENATLLRISVLTGRTHQIRVHLASEGHPLLGDRTYASDAAVTRFRRQALHAAKLEFTHPRTEKKMKFVSGLPEDLKKLADELRCG